MAPVSLYVSFLLAGCCQKNNCNCIRVELLSNIFTCPYTKEEYVINVKVPPPPIRK